MITGFLKNKLFLIFLTPFSMLLSGCGTPVATSYAQTSTIYTSVLGPTDTYTVTTGTPNSRAVCCNSTNIYYGGCSSCATMSPVVQQVYLSSPQPACPFGGTYAVGCSSRVATQSVTYSYSPVYYGYTPTCAWSSSC